jgi:2-polyprenyl-3-methyl-5-hydroxy-6-metoxy-1,4-benzoquinol methylase
MNGGYDDGYASCECFWGRGPGSLIVRLLKELPSVVGLDVLDLGCGEGKNAVHLARLGARVRAVDVSELAMNNARNAWPDAALVEWNVTDVRTVSSPPDSCDVVIAYGLLHCLATHTEVAELLRSMKRWTRPGGFNVVCTFNARSQDLEAHPGLNPVLLSHEWYCDQFIGWNMLYVSDEDLHEVHPHNKIPHSHSLTRLIAQRPYSK